MSDSKEPNVQALYPHAHVPVMKMHVEQLTPETNLS